MITLKTHADVNEFIRLVGAEGVRNYYDNSFDIASRQAIIGAIAYMKGTTYLHESFNDGNNSYETFVHIDQEVAGKSYYYDSRSSGNGFVMLKDLSPKNDEHKFAIGKIASGLSMHIDKNIKYPHLKNFKLQE